MSKNSQLMEKHNHRQLLNANSIFGTRIWKLYLEVTSSEGSLKPKCLKTLRESLVGNAQREKHKDILLLRHQNKSAQEISFIIKKIDALNSKKKKKKTEQNMDENYSFYNKILYLPNTCPSWEKADMQYDGCLEYLKLNHP